MSFYWLLIDWYSINHLKKEEEIDKLFPNGISEDGLWFFTEDKKELIRIIFKLKELLPDLFFNNPEVLSCYERESCDKKDKCPIGFDAVQCWRLEKEIWEDGDYNHSVKCGKDYTIKTLPVNDVIENWYPCFRCGQVFEGFEIFDKHLYEEQNSCVVKQ